MIYDLILVGGGLANSLIAWRLTQRNPMPRMLILGQGHQLGGNQTQTWAFHCSDLTPAPHIWLKPLISYEWECYEVRFPGFHRVFTVVIRR